MAHIEELLMDILDDNQALSLEDCAQLPGVDETLYAELVRIQATTPLLQLCRTPISPAEQVMLQSIKANIPSNIPTQTWYTPKMLWGGAIGALVLITSVFVYLNTGIPTQTLQNRTVAVHVQQPTNTMPPVVPQGVQHSEQHTELRVEQQERTQEFIAEERALLNEVSESIGRDKYVALRNLYRLYLVMQDTSSARATLLEAQKVAIELELQADIQQCSKDLERIQN